MTELPPGFSAHKLYLIVCQPFLKISFGGCLSGSFGYSLRSLEKLLGSLITSKVYICRRSMTLGTLAILCLLSYLRIWSWQAILKRSRLPGSFMVAFPGKSCCSISCTGVLTNFRVRLYVLFAKQKEERIATGSLQHQS